MKRRDGKLLILAPNSKPGDPAFGLPREGKGPVKWCRQCSRYHRARATCRLFLRERKAKSGRIVKRWCH